MTHDPDPSPHTISLAPGIFVPLSLLQWTFARSGGPGGQNVNKLNTRATLSLPLTDLASYLPPHAMSRLSLIAGHHLTTHHIQITCDQSRSQHANRQECLDKLRQLLIAALHRPKRRKPTRPSYGSQQRRLQSKRAHSQNKSFRQNRPDSSD